MATRLYLVASTAPSISPSFDAGWTSTAGAVRRMMAAAQAAATEQVTSSIGATGPSYTLSGQFVSPPLAAQTITGTVTITTRGRELASTANVNKRARSVLVYSGDGATLRGALNVWTTTSSTTELSPTTLQGQAQATNAPLTSVTCQAGDVLVVELGYGVGTSGTTPQALMEWGGVGTDHANSNADVTGSVPWVEFSADLTFQAAPSTVNGTALAGLVFGATAAGTREVSGSAAGVLAFAASASGVRAVLGAGAATFALAAAASGVVTGGGSVVFGQAAAPLAFTGSASGVRAVLGQAALPLAFAAAAVGTRTVQGAASAAFAFEAAAAGVVSTPGGVVTRPSTGTIGPPDVGLTVRPSTGEVARPSSGAVVRPSTGVVSRP